MLSHSHDLDAQKTSVYFAVPLSHWNELNSVGRATRVLKGFMELSVSFKIVDQSREICVVSLIKSW